MKQENSVALLHRGEDPVAMRIGRFKLTFNLKGPRRAAQFADHGLDLFMDQIQFRAGAAIVSLD